MKSILPIPRGGAGGAAGASKVMTGGAGAGAPANDFEGVMRAPRECGCGAESLCTGSVVTERQGQAQPNCCNVRRHHGCSCCTCAVVDDAVAPSSRLRFAASCDKNASISA